MTFEISPGTIYSSHFPFSDLESKKKRPLLALSGKDGNYDVRDAFITKTAVDEASGFSLEKFDFLGPELKHQSYVRLDKTFHLHASRLEKPVARLNDKAYERVLRKLVTVGIPNLAAFKYRDQPFRSGSTVITPSGKVIGDSELTNMVEASLDGWLTTGRFNEAFEKRFAKFVGTSHALTTTSGSSANLLAFTALTSSKLGDKALKSGDEVITVAAGFPTTVNPILQNGMVPVFVDVEIPTYNIDPKKIEAAVTERTRAIMIAHTLGNPFDLDLVMGLARKHKLWVIEDCCDALGSKYKGQHVGTFGDIATCSFYPAHHITMGEGGMVFTKDGNLSKIIESLRGWGRDCYCGPGCDNSCGKRFSQQLGSLPFGYDHKYTYSHLGYNLKITDMQAACALAQMDRLPGFIEVRKKNFAFLEKRLISCHEFLILPEATKYSEPSWFGFPITLRDSAGTMRVDLLTYLDQHNIGTRLLFAGNLTRQPYFEGLNYRISGELKNTDIVMSDTFWIGLHPGMNEDMLNFMVSKIEAYFGVNF